VTVAICVLTNGRIELLDMTIESIRDKFRAVELVKRRIIWDDSGSDEVYHYMRLAYAPDWTIVRSVQPEGFGGAMRSAWAWLNRSVNVDHIFWSEDDFVYEKVVPLDAMASVLDQCPWIAQMALRRQPWNEAEIAAGGVVELDPDAFTEASWRDHKWLEHRKFWTTNPSLFRVDLLAGGWADDPESEGRYTHRLLGEGLPWGVPSDEVRFAYWGGFRSTPAVTHTGVERVGFGY